MATTAGDVGRDRDLVAAWLAAQSRVAFSGDDRCRGAAARDAAGAATCPTHSRHDPAQPGAADLSRGFRAGSDAWLGGSTSRAEAGGDARASALRVSRNP